MFRARPASEAPKTGFHSRQAVFAALLNVPQPTAISWESGARKPSGAALKLLRLATRHPELLAG